MLKLVNDEGRVAYALLVGLTEQSALFRSGDAQQIVPLTDLAGRWHGDFATFWLPPAGYRAGGSSSGESATRDWLGQRFSTLDGTTPGIDAPLAARVSAFQLAHGLEPDGRAGPQTLMQLNRAIGVDEPRLQLEP